MEYEICEEKKETRRLYGELNPVPINDYYYDLITSKDRVRRTMEKQMRKAFAEIEPKYTGHWLSVQMGLDRTVISKMLQRQSAPSMANFLKIILYLNYNIPNFNIWFLFDEKAPLTYDKDYIPFHDYY